MGYKAESLIKLAGLGFNTPEFELLMDVGELAQHEKEFMAWERVSIRTDYTFRRPGFKLPFYPNVPWKEAIPMIDQVLRGGHGKYMVIASKGIDPQLSIAGGKYLKSFDQELIEYFAGPGTIRDLETNKVERREIDLTNHTGFPIEKCSIDMIPYTNAMQRMRGRAHLIPTPFILEWSLYPNKVGMKSERMIFWEIIYS
jgi:hypothetical protein